MAADEQVPPPDIPTDVPTSARTYDYALGGKDNFAIDREQAIGAMAGFPEALDAARENRLFLYRAVRFLARDVGIRQFLDLGSGLPTQQNVHQVVQQFQPDARVVYVDIDPIVLAHGRAMLVQDERTTVITADMAKPQEVLGNADVQRMIDFSQPVGVLFLSVLHSLTDEDNPRDALWGILDALVPDSYLAVTQMASNDQETADGLSAFLSAGGMKWQTRTPEQITEFVRGLEPVEPGLVDVNEWRPDPTQPSLNPAPPPLRPYVGAKAKNHRLFEFGGVLRKP